MFLPLISLCIVSFGQEPPNRERIQKEMDRALMDWQVPGAAMVLVGTGQSDGVFVAGRRSLDSEEKVDSQTIFPAASLSKAFTATMVSCLNLKGSLDWNDPVIKWLDWYRPRDNQFIEPIRLRHLGSHTSGYPAHDLLFYRSGSTLEGVVEKLLKLPRFDAPGRAYEYQTAQYYALALAAQNSAKVPWPDLVKQQVFQPLGIEGGIWSSAEAEKYPNRAYPHQKDDQNRVVKWGKAWADPRDNPSGGLWLPVNQWSSWLRAQAGIDDAQMQNKKGLTNAIQETRITRISQERVNQDPVFQPEVANLGYGFGWVTMTYRGEAVLAHGGVVDGFRAFILVFPLRKQALIVLSNLDRTPFNHDLGYSVADMLLGLPSAKWKNRLRKKQDDQIQAKSTRVKMVEEKTREWSGIPLDPIMIGQFVNPAYGPIELRDSKEGAWLTIFGRRVPLKRIGPDTFVFFDEMCADPELIFLREGKSGSWHIGGRVTAEFLR